MRWSRMFLPTLRENPADAESLSQQLLIRAGFARQPAPGVHIWLPLGRRVLLNLERLIRGEMNESGAQEFLVPEADHFREVARKELRSYKELPQTWYRIRTSGIAEGFSFDMDEEALDKTCRTYRDLCQRVFRLCGLAFASVEAGSRREEFSVRTETGDRSVASCECGYAANRMLAGSRIAKPVDAECSGPPVEIATPGQKTIADICDYLKVSAAQQIKSLVYIVDGEPHLFLVRGDHQLSEAKALETIGAAAARPAEPEEIRVVFGADAGSLGPVGVTNLPVYADLALQGRRNLTCGANRNDYHLQQVTPDVDFESVWADLRAIEAGESCTRCGRPLEIYKACEIGYLERLRPRASAVVVLTAEGKQAPVAMGRHGLNLHRILLSCIEMNHDNDGISWPLWLAPFPVVLTAINYKDHVKDAADRLYADLGAAGIDALLDDRQERAGVKFKDADLVGIPYRIVIGDKVKEGQVEFFERRTREKHLLEIGAVVQALRGKLAQQGKSQEA